MFAYFVVSQIKSLVQKLHATFPGADNRFELSEDDGNTTGYQRHLNRLATY